MYLSNANCSWTTGASWPHDGELDIIEGSNQQDLNYFVMHTGAGCSVKDAGKFTDKLNTPDCDVNSPSQPNNQGCVIQAKSNRGYGAEFNKNGGGVYATEWTSDAISIWFFPRESIPPNVLSSQPDPSQWGKPNARFAGGCDISQHMQEQKIVSHPCTTPYAYTCKFVC